MLKVLNDVLRENYGLYVVFFGMCYFIYDESY